MSVKDEMSGLSEAFPLNITSINPLLPTRVRSAALERAQPFLHPEICILLYLK